MHTKLCLVVAVVMCLAVVRADSQQNGNDEKYLKNYVRHGYLQVDFNMYNTLTYKRAVSSQLPLIQAAQYKNYLFGYISLLFRIYNIYFAIT